MSSITNIILISTSAGKGIRLINNWLSQYGKEYEQDDIQLKLISNYPGGNYCLENKIYAVGINRFDTGEFVKFIDSLNFDYYDIVHLLIREDGRLAYTLYAGLEIEGRKENEF